VKLGRPADAITLAEVVADWKRRDLDPERCVYTGEPLRDRSHIDHGYPLSCEGSPGHVVTNLVPCNRGANTDKGRRHWLEYQADRRDARCLTNNK